MTETGYIRRNYVKDTNNILNKLIRGGDEKNIIPIDNALLVRHSKCPKLTEKYKRKAYATYHQFKNSYKIKHYHIINNILKHNDDINEIILNKIKYLFNFGYYVQQHIFEYLQYNHTNFFYKFYYKLPQVNLLIVEPNPKYIKMGLMLMKNFPDNFKHIDKEILLHDIIVQQKKTYHNKEFASGLKLNQYFMHLFIEYDIINEYVNCQLYDTLVYYSLVYNTS